MDASYIAKIVETTTVPVVFKKVCNWPLLSWSLEDWCQNMPQKELPFRVQPPKNSSEEPCWERKCSNRMMSLEKFFEIAQKNPAEWCYFDYKYLEMWLTSDNEVYKQILWDCFGYNERGAADSTIWIGSNGAHTPCHQDTYGRNIVVQAFGKKRWLMFPPDSGGLNPTRVPYEESSIYSKLNFFSPKNLDAFKRLSGCRMVVLEPGDALIVPPKWWHYVQHVDAIGISFNTWIPHAKTDTENQIDEALIRMLVAQIGKDLTEKDLKDIVNPNEEDVSDLPLTVSIFQVDVTVQKYLEFKSKEHEDISQCSKSDDISKTDIAIDTIKKSCHAITVEELNNNDLITILQDNYLRENCNCDSYLILSRLPN
ncbi:HSPB1 associated protein 1 isoform X2 [Arctopsyche grandis]|uniref:HSPB1 associated protein 1 isoform X2 n=1 Tax=Arctopsyche grandis TaxID=121162 RepID=UPI00406DA4E3